MTRRHLSFLVAATIAGCGGKVVLDGPAGAGSSSGGAGGVVGFGGAGSSSGGAGGVVGFGGNAVVGVGASGGEGSAGGPSSFCGDMDMDPSGCASSSVTMNDDGTCTFSCESPDGNLFQDVCTAHACTCMVDGKAVCTCEVGSDVLLCGGDQTCCHA